MTNSTDAPWRSAYAPLQVAEDSIYVSPSTDKSNVNDHCKAWVKESLSSSPTELRILLDFQELTEELPGYVGRRERTLSYITLGFIAYFAVAAGPFGIEDAVYAAGPKPVLVALILLPITWGLPQALMVRGCSMCNP